MPTNDTDHLLLTTDYAIYAPLSDSSSVLVHPDFGKGKEFFMDAILKDPVLVNPKLELRLASGKSVIQVEILVESQSLSLTITSELTVQRQHTKYFNEVHLNVNFRQRAFRMIWCP